MDLSSILNSSVQNDQVHAHQNYVDIHALNQLKQQAREDQRSALKPVAEQFEALFVEQIFKESRKVKLDDGWLDGNQGGFYKDWHDKQLAQNIAAKGTLGFADNIVEQLLPSIPNIQKNNVSTEKNALNKPVDKTVETSVVQGKTELSTEQALASRPIANN